MINNEQLRHEKIMFFLTIKFQVVDLFMKSFSEISLQIREGALSTISTFDELVYTCENMLSFLYVIEKIENINQIFFLY